MRLIDADALIEETLAEGAYGYIDALQIARASTVDAVPVIRCENCQFWDNEHISSEGLAKCVTGESGIRYRRNNDFCSRGLHKEVSK